MKEYERTTTASTLAALPDPLREALTARAEEGLLSVPADSPAFLTHSRRLKRPGFFARRSPAADPDAEHVTAVVIGPRDLLVGTHGEVRGTAVLHARLEDLDVGDIGTLFRAAGVQTPEDDGMELTGFATSGEGGTSRASFYVGLGAPAGEQARTAVTDAVRAAKAA